MHLLSARLDAIWTSLFNRLQLFDHRQLTRIWLRFEPGVANLAGDGLRCRPQAHDQDIRIVPLSRAARRFGIAAECCPDAGNLISGDGNSSPRPAEEHALVNAARGHPLRDGLCNVCPIHWGAVERPVRLDLDALAL